MNYSKIPQELKGLSQWVNWKLENRKGKETKVPYQPNGKRAVSTDPQTWSTLEDCTNALDSFNGVGFVFSDGDPYTGIDWDDVRDPKTGEYLPGILEEIKGLNSYSEVSQSGEGAHAIVKADKPGDKCKKKDRNGTIEREMYDRGRFFVMTGDHIPGTPEQVNRPDMTTFRDIYGKIERNDKPKQEEQATPEKGTLKLSDSDILYKCETAINGDKFKRLWSGSTGDYGGDHSAADMALCSIFSFYTQDGGQIDRLFRHSGLMRPKWDEKRGSQTYGDKTISEALRSVTETYTEPQRREKKSNEGEKQPEPRREIKEKAQFGEVTEDLFKKSPVFIMRDSLEWYEYKEGAYRCLGPRRNALPVRQKIRDIYGEITGGKEAYPVWIGNCMSYIEDLHHLERDCVNRNPAEVVIRNGILNVETGKIEPHTPEKKITVFIDVEYDPSAECPNFERFLEGVLPKVDEFGRTKEQLKDLVFEWIGYNMYMDMPYAKSLFLVGDGGNGKGTFQRILNEFLGQENISAMSLEQIADTDKYKFRAAGLYGRLANICGDLGSRDIHNTEGFKLATGRDIIDADVKNGSPFRFVSFAKLTFSANAIPFTSDDSDGFYDRFIVINFPNKIRGSDIDDPDIKQKCTTDREKSGILNKALEGLQRVFRNNGFEHAGNTDQTRTTWQRRSDPIGHFIDTCVYEMEGEITAPEDLFDAYCIYADNNGAPKISETSFVRRFGNRITKAYPSVEKKRHWDKEKGKPGARYYLNIGMIKKETIQTTVGEDPQKPEMGQIVTDMKNFVHTRELFGDTPQVVAFDFTKAYPGYKQTHGLEQVAEIAGKLSQRGWV